jgi:hypothetical protein
MRAEVRTMAGNYKVSDDQIVQYLKKGLNNRQTALKLGLSPAGNFCKRCKELRVKNNIPEPERRNPMKSQITDEQIFALLDENKTNAEISRVLGVKQTNINSRINKLRSKHEFHLQDGVKKADPIQEASDLPKEQKSGTKRGTATPPKAARDVKPKAQPIESTYKVPVPPPGTELLRFEDIRSGDKLLRNGKPVEVVSTGRVAMTIKDRFGYKAEVTKKYFDDNPGKFTRDEALKITAGDVKVNGQPIKNLPDSVKEKIVDKLKDDAAQFAADRTQEQHINNVADTIFPGTRKAAIINPEFEAAVQEMEAALKAKKESIPCVHFTQDCTYPALDNCEECPDYQDELAKEAATIDSVSADAGPIHIDLEMDDSTDPVNLTAATDPDDYPDPEWFDKPIPRKGTVERVIWDKAYAEIGEIQKLRAILQTALNSGERLPTTYVDKYNRYVSKYIGEVGA